MILKKASLAAPLILALLLFCPAAYAEEPELPPEEPPISLNEITSIDTTDTAETEKATLKDIQMVMQGGTPYIIKLYDAPPDMDSAALDEGGFDKNGYHYTMAAILRTKETYSDQQKLASQTVTVSVQNKDGAAAKLVPFLDYSLDGYEGQLPLDRSSIYTEAAGSSRYSYGITDTKEFSGLQRNDTYYIPKTSVKNGVTLKLADVSWTAMGDGMYRATAAYTGTGSGTKITCYLSTATYLGTVKKHSLDSISYKVIYEGVQIIPPEPVKNDFPWLWAGCGLLIMLTVGGGILLFTRYGNNATLYAVAEDGDCERIKRLHISEIHPTVDLTQPSLSALDHCICRLDKRFSAQMRGRRLYFRFLEREAEIKQNGGVIHIWMKEQNARNEEETE